METQKLKKFHKTKKREESNIEIKSIALSQIFLLVVGILAFAYIIGLSSPVVRAADSGGSGSVKDGNDAQQQALKDLLNNKKDKIKIGEIFTQTGAGKGWNYKIVQSGNRFKLLTCPKSRSLCPNPSIDITNKPNAINNLKKSPLKPFHPKERDKQYGTTKSPASGISSPGRSSCDDVIPTEGGELCKIKIGTNGDGTEKATYFFIGEGSKVMKSKTYSSEKEAKEAYNAIKAKEAQYKSLEEETENLKKKLDTEDLSDNTRKEIEERIKSNEEAMAEIAKQGAQLGSVFLAKIAGKAAESSANWVGLLGNLGTNLGIAAGIFTATQGLARAFGASDKNALAFSSAFSLGYFLGKSAYDISVFAGAGSSTAAWIGLGVGGAAILITILLMYETTSTEVISFECKPWQPPLRGENCELCNEQELPCSEYQCRSLGQACELINKGSKDEKCVWVNRDDVSPPEISPYENAFLDTRFKYSPDNTISPPDRGVKIVNTESEDGKGCIPAYTPLSFGVKLNEPAKCKLDLENRPSYKDMKFSFSNGLAKYNHTYTLAIPGQGNSSTENLTLKNGGNFDVYVRCEDANGNSNEGNFVFKFCVDTGPDTTPPLIKSSSLKDKSPVAFNTSKIDNFEIYINEPVKECRWSRQNILFGQMEGKMSCVRGNDIGDMNKLGLYTCSTELNGIKDETENKFYFRCEDKAGNINQEPYKLSLMGTRALVIDSVTPNNTEIIDNTSPIKVTLKVKTSAGYKNGESACYYRPAGSDREYVTFFGDEKINNYQHTQDLYLEEGFYSYEIKCSDLGGNSDTKEITFSTTVDKDSPEVVKVYYNSPYLQVVTSEGAKCVYDYFDCSYNFEDGIKDEISSKDRKVHNFKWDSKKTYYIKCSDDFGNKPLPNQCSVIVKPFDEVRLQ